MGFELYGSEASGVDFSALDPMLIPCASRITLYNNTTIGAEELGVDYSALDVLLVPCASRIKLFDGSEIGAEDNCVWD